MGFTHSLREENQYAPEGTSTQDRSPGKCMRWSTRLVCGSRMGENRLGLVSFDQATLPAHSLALHTQEILLSHFPAQSAN